MHRYRRPPGRLTVLVLGGVALFAVGAICGYLTAVTQYDIYRPPDCTVSSCTSLSEAPWPIGAAGALVGGIAYAALGLAAGLPGNRLGVVDEQITRPGGLERTAAALGHISLLLGAVRAAGGDIRAYPGNWPPRPDPRPGEVDPLRRERRARLALVVLILAVAANVVRLVVT